MVALRPDLVPPGYDDFPRSGFSQRTGRMPEAGTGKDGAPQVHAKSRAGMAEPCQAASSAGGGTGRASSCWRISDGAAGSRGKPSDCKRSGGVGFSSGGRLAMEMRRPDRRAQRSRPRNDGHGGPNGSALPRRPGALASARRSIRIRQAATGPQRHPAEGLDRHSPGAPATGTTARSAPASSVDSRSPRCLPRQMRAARPEGGCRRGG